MGCGAQHEPPPAPIGQESWPEYCETCRGLIGAARAADQERRLAEARRVLAALAVQRQQGADAESRIVADSYRTDDIRKGADGSYYFLSVHPVDRHKPRKGKGQRRWRR